MRNEDTNKNICTLLFSGLSKCADEVYWPFIYYIPIQRAVQEVDLIFDFYFYFFLYFKQKKFDSCSFDRL